jgi:type VI protein secretion system component Hcp
MGTIRDRNVFVNPHLMHSTRIGPIRRRSFQAMGSQDGRPFDAIEFGKSIDQASPGLLEELKDAWTDGAQGSTKTCGGC